MEEVWQELKGYKGLYKISNFGNMYSYPKKAGWHNRPGRHIKYDKVKPGRYQVTLKNNSGISKRYKVHRLVALQFIPNPENKPCINHKDSNMLNNKIDNLEWVTYRENNMHRELNKRGMVGASKHKSGQWQSSIYINGKSEYIGIFKCPLEAHLAYIEKINYYNIKSIYI